jgi:S-adenosylmethionine hydrolase
MLVLFTDFGVDGPYVGQMKAVLARDAPGVPVIDLLHRAPEYNARASAYLLGALAATFPTGAVFICVVDPGVGTDRRALALQADGRWFVGPDNGLLELVTRRASAARAHAIAWRPERLSASFHGRDLFAPVAARLARGDRAALAPADLTRFPDWPDDLPEVVHVDGYGTAWTGLRAAALSRDATLLAGGRRLAFARTFSAAPEGEPFWYENSSGLAEVAVNRGSAAERLGLAPGAPVAPA